MSEDNSFNNNLSEKHQPELVNKNGIKEPKVGIFKTSDYDLNWNQIRAKYKDYAYVFCEKCNQGIDKWYFYCEGCYDKKTDGYERICMKYGKSKVGIFKTSDYNLNRNQRQAKYED